MPTIHWPHHLFIDHHPPHTLTCLLTLNPKLFTQRKSHCPRLLSASHPNSVSSLLFLKHTGPDPTAGVLCHPASLLRTVLQQFPLWSLTLISGAVLMLAPLPEEGSRWGGPVGYKMRKNSFVYMQRSRLVLENIQIGSSGVREDVDLDLNT